MGILSQDYALTMSFFVEDAAKQKEPECLEFIKKKFMEMDTDGSSPVTTHFTCALDTENIKVIFTVVKTELLKGAINDLQLF